MGAEHREHVVGRSPHVRNGPRVKNALDVEVADEIETLFVQSFDAKRVVRRHC